MDLEWRDILLFLLGAILGAVLNRGYQLAETPVAQKIRQRAVDRRKAALSTERVHRWLISYHEQRGTLASLYNCRIGDYDVRVPVITRHEWLTSAPVRPERDPLIRFALGHEQSFPV